MSGIFKFKVPTGMAAGNLHSLAVTWDGQAIAWGSDVSGQVGSTPVPTSVVRAPVGGGHHGCAANKKVLKVPPPAAVTVCDLVRSCLSNCSTGSENIAERRGGHSLQSIDHGRKWR
jgi:hypothetical protein